MQTREELRKGHAGFPAGVCMCRLGAAYTAERSEECKLLLHYSAGDDSSAAMRGLSEVVLTVTVSLKPGRVPIILFPIALYGATVSINNKAILSIFHP